MNTKKNNTVFFRERHLLLLVCFLSNLAGLAAASEPHRYNNNSFILKVAALACLGIVISAFCIGRCTLEQRNQTLRMEANETYEMIQTHIHDISMFQSFHVLSEDIEAALETDSETEEEALDQRANTPPLY